MCLSMICLLRLSFKIGNLCNALFVYDVANNFYLITRILKKIIDIVCFKIFKNDNSFIQVSQIYCATLLTFM